MFRRHSPRSTSESWPSSGTSVTGSTKAADEFRRFRPAGRVLQALMQRRDPLTMEPRQVRVQGKRSVCPVCIDRSGP